MILVNLIQLNVIMILLVFRSYQAVSWDYSCIPRVIKPPALDWLYSDGDEDMEIFCSNEGESSDESDEPDEKLKNSEIRISAVVRELPKRRPIRSRSWLVRLLTVVSRSTRGCFTIFTKESTNTRSNFRIVNGCIAVCVLVC